MDDGSGDVVRAELAARITACLCEADELSLHLVAAHLDSALHALETQDVRSFRSSEDRDKPLQ